MCAAPGSKTTQLIEMLHADMSVPFPGNHCGAGKLLWVVIKEKSSHFLLPGSDCSCDYELKGAHCDDEFSNQHSETQDPL